MFEGWDLTIMYQSLPPTYTLPVCLSHLLVPAGATLTNAKTARWVTLDGDFFQLLVKVKIGREQADPRSVPRGNSRCFFSLHIKALYLLGGAGRQSSVWKGA